MIKIHEKSVLVTIKMETRKRTQQKHRKITENVENGAQNGSPDVVIFWSSGFFFCARRPWEPKWLPSLPQEPPRPVQASISIDVLFILDEFLMIVCIMWATFYLVCLITLTTCRLVPSVRILARQHLAHLWRHLWPPPQRGGGLTAALPLWFPLRLCSYVAMWLCGSVAM